MLSFRADLHAHPGQLMLAAYPDDHRMIERTGGSRLGEADEAIRAAGMGLVSFATVSDVPLLRSGAAGLTAVREFEAGEALEVHRRQLAAIRALAAEPGHRLVLGSEVAEAAHEAGELGVFVACEGGDFLEGQISRVAEAHGDGVRSIQLVHYRVNELGDIQTEAPVHGGLTEFGGAVVEEMNRLGMLVDLAHAPWSVTRDVLDRSSAPVMISHSHLASGEDWPARLLSEEHALAVAEGGGVIGAWPSGMVLGSFDEYLDEIVRMVELLGAEHVGIGTDMDGNYQPVMTAYDQFAAIEGGLEVRGLGEEERGLLLGRNLLRLLREVEVGAG
jgi:membrane dipeptidase